MFNDIINTVPDPIFVKDKKHRFMFVNQAFLESLGCKIEDVLGKSDVDFFSERESKVFYRLDRKTFKSEKTTKDKVLKFACAQFNFSCFTTDQFLLGPVPDSSVTKFCKTSISM